MAKPSSSSDNGDLPDIPETVAFTTATTSQTTNELPLTTSSTLAHFTYVLTIYRYVLLCLLFGSMSVVIGFTLLSISLILRAKTSSLHLIESVPLYMPGLILICNGISMIAFMNKNTRRFYLLKSVCGLFLLVALLLIIIVVTTSVIHLPRLHTHRECAYTQRLRACTCVQNAEQVNSIASKHFIVEDVANCQIVHGIIYDCLRVVFALSIFSILISVFSIITLYQIYIHEKQKIYFNQLNSLRKQMQLKNLEKCLESASLNYLNYLSTAENITNESSQLAQIKCLSADFSSQDFLIDQSSTNFGVTNSNDKSNLSMRARIWSSQSSNHVAQNDCQSEHINYDDEHKSANLRRYMSAIIDTSNNVQSFVRQKLNSFKRINTIGSKRLEQSNTNPKTNSKNPILPPHVHVIPRFSMAQSPLDSTTSNNLYTSHQTSETRQVGKSSSFSSSYTSSTTSSPSTSRSKSKESHQKHIDETLTLHESSFFPPSNHLESTFVHQTELAKSNFDRSKAANSTSNDLFTLPTNIASIATDFCEKSYNNLDQMPSTVIVKNDLFIDEITGTDHEHNQSHQMLNERNWPDSNLMETFECVDEDECCNLDIQIDLSKVSHFNDKSSPVFESDKTSIFTQSGKFTFESDRVNEKAYLTKFEEAFKNYYDSQNRISNYYTMPLKVSKEKTKRKSHVQLNYQQKANHQFEQTEVRNDQQDANNYIAHIPFDSCDDKENCLNKANINLIVSDEMPFPAIEPPVDYQNVAVKDNTIEKSNVIEVAPMGDHLIQPYQNWIHQFINQMNQLAENTKADNHISYEEYDTMANGFVEDEEEEEDGAGDTSTSQDIADFELDFDDEPINFLNDEECKAKMENKVDKVAKPIANVKILKQEEIFTPKEERNLLQKNTDLIKRAVHLNNVTADYGFDGFRKGCFEDDSSTSSESSLSNHTDSSKECTTSITAECIKPPTPFTNYYNLNV